MATEYLTERDRWVTSAAAEREEMVRAILDQQQVSSEHASAVLGLPAWSGTTSRSCSGRTRTQTGHPTDLQRAAARMLRDTGCSGTLDGPARRVLALGVGIVAQSRSHGCADLTSFNHRNAHRGGHAGPRDRADSGTAIARPPTSPTSSGDPAAASRRIPDALR